MWHDVWRVGDNVSEENTASILRIEIRESGRIAGYAEEGER